MKRFREIGETLYHFGYLFLVRYPRCEKCAEIVFREGRNEEQEARSQGVWPYLFAPRRLVCSHCGYNKDWQGREVSSNDAQDWYFRQPLWLQTSCCGEVLWALNGEHLNFLEEYVGAGLRESYPDGTMASRLPVWMKSAKNREAVLKGIRKLREMLP